MPGFDSYFSTLEPDSCPGAWRLADSQASGASSSSAPGGGDRLFDAKKLRLDRIFVASHQEPCDTPTVVTAPAKGPKTQEWSLFSQGSLISIHCIYLRIT